MRWAFALLLLSCRSKSADTARATPTASVVVPAPASAPAQPPPAMRAAGDWGMAVRGDGTRAIVYFHGMYASPEDSCSYFEIAAKPRGTLICPRGPGGGHFVEATTKARELGHVDDGGVLMGFSIGAKTALDFALREKKWSGLFLMSMNLALSAASLRAANVKGVVLAAGGGDGSFAQLKSQAATLERSGYPARFISLGDNVGHHFGPNMESIAKDALEWLDAIP